MTMAVGAAILSPWMLLAWLFDREWILNLGMIVSCAVPVVALIYFAQV